MMRLTCAGGIMRIASNVEDPMKIYDKEISIEYISNCMRTKYECLFHYALNYVG